jgi:hypothetical protein
MPTAGLEHPEETGYFRLRPAASLMPSHLHTPTLGDISLAVIGPTVGAATRRLS